MKNKTICISDENFDSLKDVNASQLINEMLNKHFQLAKVPKDIPIEKIEEIYEIAKQVEALQAKQTAMEKECKLTN